MLITYRKLQLAMAMERIGKDLVGSVVVRAVRGTRSMYIHLKAHKAIDVAQIHANPYERCGILLNPWTAQIQISI